jgi:hypothetical protein
MEASNKPQNFPQTSSEQFEIYVTNFNLFTNDFEFHYTIARTILISSHF